jgi:hypothetical protein
MDHVVINVVCRMKKKIDFERYTNYMFKRKGASICKIIRAKDYNLMRKNHQTQKKGKGKVSFSLRL